MAATGKRSSDASGPPAKRANGTVATNLRQADWEELSFGKPFANKYDGFHIGFGFGDSRNRLTLQMTKPPETVRAPFEPKVHDTVGGGGGGKTGDPSFALELDDAAYAKMVKFEDAVKTSAVANRDAWFAKGKHAPTARPKTTDDQLRWDFRSSVKEGNPEKGWRPTLRVGISKASPPTILLTEVKPNGKMASPRLGTVDDLVANAALIPTVRPNGGVWVGGLGFGVKWVLETCLIVTNKGSSTGAQLDMGAVEFESDEAEEDAAVAAVAAEAW